MNKDASLLEIKGIGEKTYHLFQKLGVYSFEDMLLYFPRTYLQYPEVRENLPREEGTVAILARIVKQPLVKRTRKMDIVTCDGVCGGEAVHFVWFRSVYLAKTLRVGSTFVFYGKCKMNGQILQMEQPKVFTIPQYEALRAGLLPIYDLTAGLSNATVIKTVKQVFARQDFVRENLPGAFLKKYKLPQKLDALYAIHFPKDFAEAKEARSRMAYEEFLEFILCMKVQKEHTGRLVNDFNLSCNAMQQHAAEHLGYSLTNAQSNALREMNEAVTGEHVMHRLLQGDVGSGKTILAFLMMLRFAENGYQSALMAPTEVLAYQHFSSLKDFLSQHAPDFSAICLTGGMKASEKRKAREEIAKNPKALIVGTHALIEEQVEYCNLGLVITDEQHRFGVAQRTRFSDKGIRPHVLVMSATPIPRTLGMILYGDLDISILDEVPKNRLPIKNCVVGKEGRPAAYKHMEKEIVAGHQVYVICPMVENAEDAEIGDPELENVIDYADRLTEWFGDRARVGFLHGRMKPSQKDEIMQAFAAHDLDILVSTTVIEVGINVPNATVMMVEDAQRFGLAQLHQLRGRVGRGDAQSYCIFIKTAGDDEAQKRLEVLNHSNDGFFIAEEDLRLRGPGDYFGLRQSGDFVFKIGDIYRDKDLLTAASKDALEILRTDPELTEPEHANLRAMIGDKIGQFTL